jgi:hypothetical protein
MQKTQSRLLNSAAADPLTIASQAQSTAGAIVAPQSYPSLSNVFGDALNSVATAQRPNAYSNNPWYSPYANIPPAPIGGGSAVQAT